MVPENVNVNCKTHSSKPCVLACTPQQSRVMLYMQHPHKQMVQKEYELLQRLSGRSFTHTVCAPTTQARTGATHSLAAFEQLDCKSQHLLIDVPYKPLLHHLVVCQPTLLATPLDTPTCALVPEHALAQVSLTAEAREHLQAYARVWNCISTQLSACLMMFLGVCKPGLSLYGCLMQLRRPLWDQKIRLLKSRFNGCCSQTGRRR